MSYKNHKCDARGSGVSRRAMVAAMAGGAVAASLAYAGIPARASASDMSWLIGDVERNVYAVRDALSLLRDDLKALDFAKLSQDSATLSEASHLLNDSMQGILWDAGEIVPVVGYDVTVARELVSTLINLTDNAVVPVANALGAHPINTLLWSADGSYSVNLPALQEIIDAVRGAMPILDSTLEQLRGYDELHVGELSEVVDTGISLLERYQKHTDLINLVMDAVPSILGANESRNYLVIAQNNVEIRATGGFTGALGIFNVTGGTLTMGEFGSIGQFPHVLTGEYVPITDEERDTWGTRIEHTVSEFNATPDFPSAAKHWQDGWRILRRQHINGVIALDPVFLQQVLGFLGQAIWMDDGSVLDGWNTAHRLMHEVYVEYAYDPDYQDEYFAEAARKAMPLVMSHLFDASLRDIKNLVMTAGSLRRLNIWFENEREQQLARLFKCDNAIEYDPFKPEVGIYLTDDTWSKIDYYLGVDYWLGEEALAEDGTHVYPISIVVTNLIDDYDLSEAGSYIIGGVASANPNARAWGDMLTEVNIMAPADGSVRLDVYGDSDYTLVPDLWYKTCMGRAMWISMVQLMPGQSVTMVGEVYVPPNVTARPVFDVTPFFNKFSQAEPIQEFDLIEDDEEEEEAPVLGEGGQVLLTEG